MVKWIALFLMIIDHTAIIIQDYISYDVYYLMRAIGRLCFPLFVYMVAKGVQRTSNKNMYLFHLGVFGIATEIIRNLFDIFSFNVFNVMIAFFFYAVSYFLIEAISSSKNIFERLLKFSMYVIIVLMTPLLEYGFSGFLLFWLFVLVLKKDFGKEKSQLVSFLGMALIFNLPDNSTLQLICIFSVFLMFNQNWEKRVFAPKIEKYSFYVFYPLQFLLLGLIWQYIL